MIRRLHAGEAGGVLLHKIDRSARNLRDWLEVRDLLSINVEVHFTNDNIDLTTRMGRMTANFQAMIAEDYIANLQEEALKGFRGRLNQKLYPLGAPVGYVDNGGGKPKTIDPVRGPLVLQLFELYATGEYSIRMLLAEARKIGLTNKYGRPITKGCLDRILLNPFYIGIIKIGKWNETFIGIHEPLISQKLFEQVQKVKSRRYVKKETKHTHMFRGIFNCSHCCRSMIGELQKGHVYYRCHNRACTTKTIREDRIENLICAQLRAYTILFEEISRLGNALDQWLKEYANGETTDPIPMQLKQLEQEKDQLADAYMSGLFDNETIKRKTKQLQSREIELGEKQQKQSNKNENIDQIRSTLELLKSPYFAYNLANKQEKRQLLKIIGSNRSLDNEKLVLEPRNWVRTVTKFATVPLGPATGTKTRSSNHLGEDEINQLLEITNCPYFQQLLPLCEAIMKRNEPNDIPIVETV